MVATGAAPYKPSDGELQQIRAKTDELATVLKRLRADDALLADVEVYHKAAVWIVRYANEEFYSKQYVADTLAVLDRGLARAKELAAGKPSWPAQKGRLVRAYRSRVDGSVQPYALTIPDHCDGRLDVVLHGRGGTLNEVSFIAAHETTKPLPADQRHMILEVFGRVNNAYRWAGETDVFEAIASVRQRYRFDENKVVLRGFSMGGAGAWHLGLQYPDLWAAVEAGAGFTDTKRYARLDNLPAYQDATLRIYDAVDYAPNACNVPFVGYCGEDDKSLPNTTSMREALTQEGFHFTPDGLNWIAKELRMLFLVGPKTGHKFHPDSKQRSEQFIQGMLPRKTPSHVRFVTYTTRYNRCFGIEVLALEKHYQRAEVEVRRDAGGKVLAVKTRNVARLAIDGKEVRSLAAPLRKTHGLQGPIDDAFMESFLCVQPSGPADARLELFRREFAKWMRGEVRVKADTAVTAEDIASHNLILFGDPSSNKLIAQLAGRLPIRWTKDAIVVGKQTFSTAEHTLALIYPNPLNPRRYVVLNSGHTFGEKEFRGTNALLFPRLGDYAVLKRDGTVVLAGLFGENWEL
jgi:pimeloyl-ACP methyl ester carboxylesterase